MDPLVRLSTYEEVWTLFGRAIKRERLSSRETKNTDWFILELDGEPIGCAGVIWLKGGAVRLKTDFILPEWRGQGYYEHLIDARLTHARDQGAQKAHINTRTPEVFLRRGWRQTEGKGPNHMEKDLWHESHTSNSA